MLTECRLGTESRCVCEGPGARDTPVNPQGKVRVKSTPSGIETFETSRQGCLGLMPADHLLFP